MTGSSTPARRPRDRRQQIIAAASTQFVARGFHNVGVADIGEAVGITSGALYRHFSGKQDLLLATVQDAIDRVGTVWSGDYDGLGDLLAATCATAIERRHGGVLWAREIGHLPVATQREARRQLLISIEPLRAAIQRSRPDLSTGALDVALWAVASVVASTGYHAVKLEPGRFQQLLSDACQSICVAQYGPMHEEPHVPSVLPRPAHTLLPASRHEAILIAAMRLFGARGYQAVGVDDIGAAAGITGATVYHHFANKSAILVAVLTRCLEAMFFDLAGALHTASAEDALDRLLRHVVRASIEHGSVVTALMNEVLSLPDDVRASLRQAQQDYLAEWTALLVSVRPELTNAEARVLVYAALSAVSSVVAIPRLRTRATLDQELHVIGRAILGVRVARTEPAQPASLAS
jgi:AcrR family transcriptional regulator